MKRFIKTALYSCATLLTLSVLSPCSAKSVVLKTGAIRGGVAAKVDGKTMLYISEANGTVSLNGLDGSQAWRRLADNPALAFEILAKDIDGDGNDDLLLASGNGSVYAWGSDGDLLWKFTTPLKTRLCQVATIGSGVNTKIYAGGNDYNLYELSSEGDLLTTTPLDGSVLKIDSGDFIEDGKDILFVQTMQQDQFNARFFGFIDPTTKKVLKRWDKGENPFPKERLMVHDLVVGDIDKDGRDDVIIAGSAVGSYQGDVYAFNGELEVVFSVKEREGDMAQRYAHAHCALLFPLRDEVITQFGGLLRLYNLKGDIVAMSGEEHKGIIYNSLIVIPEEKLCIGLGQVGGDNTLYCYDLKDKNWVQTKQEFGGLYSEVKDNLKTLYEQSIKFKRPSYQPKQENDFTVLGLRESMLDPKVKALSEGSITFVSGLGGFSESTDRSQMVKEMGPTAELRDWRKKYNNTREEIIEAARQKEAAGEPFEVWAGHGTDPFYIHIETIEQMIAVAPNTCRGLVYAEMVGAADPRVVHFVNEYMPRIAKAIHDNNAKTKLYFRFKNMFWAADCHEPIWKEMFFSGKYNDILIPSAEDTNNRLQELNLSGRVGMFLSKNIPTFAMRLVDDNPTSWRPYAPCGQRSVSPYLRHAALAAAYGSRHGLLFNIAYLEDPGYNMFFALNNSGLIPQLEPEDILSVGSWALIKNLDEEFLERVRARDGHDLLRYRNDDDNAVISLSGIYWAGTDIPRHDFSSVAMGAEYRWLNFIPKMPNGMVPIAESRYAPTLITNGVEYIETDINHGFVDGKMVDGKEFGDVMREVVHNGGDKLLMRVDGASWSLFRIDDRHARLVVIDPGFVEPSECKSVITLQNIMPLKATDILTGEDLSIAGDKIHITVPAGSMRFIDFEYPISL